MNAPRAAGGGSNNKANKGKSNRGGGRSRNRNRGKANRNKGNRGSGGGRRGPPQSPQTKICLRNIGNTDVYGTVQAIAERIIQPLVAQANERLETKLCLDEASLLKLVEGDKLAKQAREAWQKQQQQKEQEDAEAEKQEKKAEEEEATPSRAESMASEPKAEDDTTAAALVTGMKELDMNEKSTTRIFVRPIYAVPPKKTRRRGEKPGNAYLILTTPPIPAVEMAPPPAVEEAPAAEGDGGEMEGAGNHDVTTEAVPPPPPPTPVKMDYSRQMAERQLALERAVEALHAVAVASREEWAGCVVEEAKNPKSWRPPQRKDHREGTVQDSPGFKAFLEMAVKEKQDLQARPKPTPGGGLAALSTGLAVSNSSAASNTNDGGKPVAALVLHLQKKREHEKVLKKKKRKVKDSQKKAVASPDNNNVTTNNGKSETAKNKSRRQRKNKRNNASVAKKEGKS